MYSRIKLQTLNLIEFENALGLFLKEATFNNYPIVDTNVCIYWKQSAFGKLWEAIHIKDREFYYIKDNNNKYSTPFCPLLDLKILRQ